MELWNIWNADFLWPVTIFLVVTIFLLAIRKQRRALAQMNEFLAQQKMTNQQLNLAIRELRHANHYLAELAGMEYIEEAQEESPSSTAAFEASQRPSSSSQHKLYVGNIDYSATESELASYFSRYGEIEFINIPVNRYNGKTRGFGFVKFISKTDAEKAMEALHGTEFKGRQIQVNFAKERELAG